MNTIQTVATGSPWHGMGRLGQCEAWAPSASFREFSLMLLRSLWWTPSCRNVNGQHAAGLLLWFLTGDDFLRQCQAAPVQMASISTGWERLPLRLSTFWSRGLLLGCWQYLQPVLLIVAPDVLYPAFFMELSFQSRNRLHVFLHSDRVSHKTDK